MSLSSLPIAAMWDGETKQQDMKVLWSEAFIGIYESVYLSRVFSGQADDELVDRSTFRRIPQDLIPEKCVRNLPRNDMEKLYTHWRSVDARTGDAFGTTPSPDWGPTAFADKIEGLRNLAQSFGTALINEHFTTQFSRRYPLFVFGHGRRMLTLADFVDFMEQFELTPSCSLNGLRGMVRFVLYSMWNKSNPWAVHGERYILDFCQLEYSTGRELADGTKKARSHRGGCMKAILVKQKGNLLAKIAQTYTENFFEKFYKRDVLSCEVPKLKMQGLLPSDFPLDGVTREMFDQLMANPPAGIDPGTWSEAKTASIKESFLKASQVKYLVRCKISSHGFDGLLLLTECHPGRNRVDHPAIRTAPATPPSSQKSEAEVLSIVTQYLKHSSNKKKRGFCSMVKAQNTGRTDEFLKELADASKEIFPDGRKRAKVTYREGSDDDGYECLNRKPTACKVLLLSDDDDDNDSLLNEQVPGSRKNKPKESPPTPDLTSDGSEDDDAITFGSKPMDGIDAHEKVPASKPATKPVTKPKTTKKAAPKPAASPVKAVAVVDNAANAVKFYDASKPRELRMLEKDKLTKCQCASHLDVLGYSGYDHAYFADAFVSKKTHWPKTCFDCEGLFHVGSVEKEGHCKVDAKHQVYGCAHAMNGNKECMKALCTPCRAACISGKASRRNRRAPTQVMCGEHMDADGNVSAV